MGLKKLILVGAGGHCNSCIDVIELENQYEIIGLVDTKENLGEYCRGYEISYTDDDIEELAKIDCYFLISLGQIKSVDLRKKLTERVIKAGGKLATIISPLSYVSKTARIGKGSIIMHHALVNSDAEIGENSIVNTKALIEHGVRIGDFCHISTGAIVNGDSKVGKNSFIGSGSVVVHHTSVPSNYFLRAKDIFIK